MARAKRKASVPTGGYEPSQYILNCDESLDQEDDWTIEDAVSAGEISRTRRPPAEKDLRETWWKIDDQGKTGACVGYATAYGVLRWHYVMDNLMRKNDKPSARFIWMANKETDKITNYPTKFLESQGTQTKFALRVAKQYGCVQESILPMDGSLCFLSSRAFYTKAARFRIASYHNLGRDLGDWKRWLAFKGPILTRLNVDQTWMQADNTRGKLGQYLVDTTRGGHAVCLVGYTPEYFIVRNSWGTSWGKNGFGFASYEYTEQAFTEAYGAVL